jgi:hypothetical protein
MLVEGVAARRYVRLLAFMHGQPLPCLAADPKTMLDTACSYEHARGCGTTLVLMDVSTARRRQLSTSQARLRRRALLKRFSLRLVCRSAGWLRLGAELVVSSHQLLASASDTRGGGAERGGWAGSDEAGMAWVVVAAWQGRADGRRRLLTVDCRLSTVVDRVLTAVWRVLSGTSSTSSTSTSTRQPVSQVVVGVSERAERKDASGRIKRGPGSQFSFLCFPPTHSATQLPSSRPTVHALIHAPIHAALIMPSSMPHPCPAQANPIPHHHSPITSRPSLAAPSSRTLTAGLARPPTTDHQPQA